MQGRDIQNLRTDNGGGCKPAPTINNLKTNTIMWNRHYNRETGLEETYESGIENRTCDGIESYDYYEDERGNERVRYCFTHYSGATFECEGATLEECEEMKNDWLENGY